MKYKSLIKLNQNFQASVNLQFDLNKTSKIDTYIPTTQSVNILKKYLNAVYNDNYNEDNATVLIGPYGRGKSHLLLILSSVISGINESIDRECLENLLNKISSVDSEAGELADMIIKRNKPMLTVIINSNYTDINQSFILGLREALERQQLINFFPKTYFDSALNMISTWEDKYESAIQEFNKQLRKNKTTLNKIKNGLKQCSHDDYRMFCEIYPKITNGAEFNPMQNTDIVKMYSNVAEALSEQKNYSGIFIIFDEFSKFLESSSVYNDMQNFKIIQDFAELSARRSHMHICCVTHKEILDYSQSDSFRTVDGRFKKVYFVASAEQSYELVANAFEHTEKFEKFYSKHQEQFNIVSQVSYRTGIFNALTEDKYNDIIIKRCFPLHPITVYSLIRISEKVGQNERTLFTFLSQSEQHTLQEFIDKDVNKQELYLMTPDYVFDYFSELFRIEVFNPKIHSIWVKANSALKQTKDIFQQIIIKTIAVFGIVADDKLVSNSNNLKVAVNMSDEVFNTAISMLQKNHILTLQRNNEFAFLTPNGVDIRKAIHNNIEQGVVRCNRSEILQSAYFVPYILPRQYNADKCMMRYFRTAFMEAVDFQEYNGDFREFRSDADGLILYLITDNNKIAYQVSEKLNYLNLPKNIVVCITENWTDNDILMEYSAVCLLENEKQSKDSYFIEELKLFKEDLFKSIQSKVNKIYSPTNHNASYYNDDLWLDGISSTLFLNRQISAICINYYSSTPIINNEMVNKNHITSQIRKARVKLIDWILNHKEDIPMIEGYGPEVSLLRSTIFVKGLNKSVESNDNCLNEVLEKINQFVHKGEDERTSFSAIYDELSNAPYGMRRGIISIYIAYILRQYTDTIIIYYNDKEVNLDGELFNKIDSKPEEYELRLEKGTAEKERYLDAIIEMFSKENHVQCLSERQTAVSAIQIWFRGLPKFARDSLFIYTDDEPVKVSDTVIKFRKKVNLFDLNPHEFLFDFVPDVFECQDNYDNVITRLIEFKADAETFIGNIKKYIIKKVINIFDVNISGSLCSVMYEWYNTLASQTHKNIFDADTNTFLKFISTVEDFNDEDMISRLAKNIEMIAIEDWNDSMVEKFIADIRRCVETVNDYERNVDDTATDENISISFNYNGKPYEKSMSNMEISGMAETVLNNIESTFEDYGDSISAQERITVLLKLLKNEIDQI